MVSPVSLATVLSLLYQGATDRSKTAIELQNILGMKRGPSKNAFEHFLNELKVCILLKIDIFNTF